MFCWIEHTIQAHLHSRLKTAWCNNGKIPLQRFSVGVIGNYANIQVALVVDIQASTCHISKIFSKIPRLVKDSVSADAGDFPMDNNDKCWLCLENYKQTEENGSGTAFFCDFFGCGHSLCVFCQSDAKTLQRCGICRRPNPTDNALLEEITNETNSILRASTARPEHDPDVIREVDALMKSMHL
jgi:hypothetical protein